MIEKSKILNVTMNTVHRWEIDSAVPRKSMLVKMADYYGVPVCWLQSETSSAALVEEAEQNLLSMYREMPENCRYKVLSFVARMYKEECKDEQAEQNTEHDAEYDPEHDTE